MKTRRISSLLERSMRDERGSPLVELALVLPVLLVMVFGTLEFANILYQQHILTKGVQEAARFAARNPSVNQTIDCPPTSGAWSSTVAAAANIATTGNPAGTNPILPNFSASDVTVTVECPASGGLISSNPSSGSIPVVLVRAEIDARNLGFLSLINITDLQLSAEHREMGVGL